MYVIFDHYMYKCNKIEWKTFSFLFSLTIFQLQLILAKGKRQAYTQEKSALDDVVFIDIPSIYTVFEYFHPIFAPGLSLCPSGIAHSGHIFCLVSYAFFNTMKDVFCLGFMPEVLIHDLITCDMDG